MAFPNLIRGITIIHVMMYLLIMMQPGAIMHFVFDLEKIRTGEVWRIGSFLLLPPRFGGGSLGIIFMFFAMMIAFLINDALENSWGIFRTSLYCFGTMLCQVVGLLALHFLGYPSLSVVLSSMGGLIFYEAIFLAFATSFPRHEFRLFLVLPVQVWVLGVVSGVILILQSIRLVTQGLPGIFQATFLYFVLLPYFVWAIPRLLRYSRQRGEVAARRANFQRHITPEGESFHQCEQCGATDVTHPDRDFRIAEDERELCEICLSPPAGQEAPSQGSGN